MMCCLGTLVVFEPILNRLKYIFYKGIHLPCMVLYIHQLNFYLWCSRHCQCPSHMPLAQTISRPVGRTSKCHPWVSLPVVFLCHKRVYFPFSSRAWNARNYTPWKQASTNGHWEWSDTYPNGPSSSVSLRGLFNTVSQSPRENSAPEAYCGSLLDNTPLDHFLLSIVLFLSSPTFLQILVSRFCLLGEKTHARYPQISFQMYFLSPSFRIQSGKENPHQVVQIRGDLIQGIGYQERRGEPQIWEATLPSGLKPVSHPGAQTSNPQGRLPWSPDKGTTSYYLL